MIIVINVIISLLSSSTSSLSLTSRGECKRWKGCWLQKQVYLLIIQIREGTPPPASTLPLPLPVCLVKDHAIARKPCRLAVIIPLCAHLLLNLCLYFQFCAFSASLWSAIFKATSYVSGHHSPLCSLTFTIPFESVFNSPPLVCRYYLP